MRRLVLSALAVGAVGAAVVVTVAATRPTPDRTASGTTIGGLRAGDLDRQGLRDLLVRAAAQSPADVAVTLGSRRLTVRTKDVGVALDIPATVDRALEESGAERRWGLLDQVQGRAVTPVVTQDRNALDRSVARLEEAAEQAEFHGALRYVDGDLVVEPPRGGQTASTQDITGALTRAVEHLPWPSRIDVPVEILPAHTTVEDLQPLLASARAVLVPTLTLRAGTRTTSLDARGLGLQLSVVTVGDDETGHEVALGLKPTALSALAVPAANALTAAPVEPRVAAPEATPQLEAQGNVTWRPTPVRTRLLAGGRPGQSVLPAAVLEALTEVVRGGVAVPTRDLPASVRPAKTSDAAARGIDAALGTFTTRFSCCQPRVRNIALMARTIDETLVGPGQTFSLNGIVGRRTAAKGYVDAPFILDGELSTDVGGGVSQVATTTFNAALFAGLRLDRHQAHSFYISRYPAGREATLNYPSIDLRWTNTTSSAVLLRASTTQGSVTVTLYGRNDGRTVESTSGPRVAVPNRDFRITVTRVLTVPGQQPRRESITTTYNKPPEEK